MVVATRTGRIPHVYCKVKGHATVENVRRHQEADDMRGNVAADEAAGQAHFQANYLYDLARAAQIRKEQSIRFLAAIHARNVATDRAQAEAHAQRVKQLAMNGLEGYGFDNKGNIIRKVAYPESFPMPNCACRPVYNFSWEMGVHLFLYQGA